MRQNESCKWFSKISIPERWAFLSAMLVGFLTHSFIMYNKMSYLDDCIYYFKLGATYSSGRWGLGIIEAVLNWLELQPYSMPLTNGLLTIFFIALMAVVLVRMLGVKTSLTAALMGAYMVVFPTVTSTFSYMFTAPWYFFAGLLMVLAVYLVRKTKKATVPAILMIAFGMGIYQAYIGVATAVFVIALICDARKRGFAKNIATAIHYLITLLVGIILYFGLNKFFLWFTKTELSDYQGINGMLSMSIANVLSGALEAYKLWPKLTRWEIVGISNTNLIRFLYAVCLILFLILTCLHIAQIQKKKELLNTLYSAVLFVLVPLSLGVIYVMTASSEAYVHTLMVYNLIFIPIYPLVLMENLDTSVLKEKAKKPVGWLRNIAMTVIAAMAVFYAGLDNAAYLKAYQQQEAAISYYTTLVTQIKSVENYSDTLPVAFVGNLDGQDTSISNQAEFDEIQIQGYHANMNTIISYYTTPEYIQLHCGYYFVPPYDMEKVYASEEVAQMPSYPRDGSIRVVDDVVVVKFSDIY